MGTIGIYGAGGLGAHLARCFAAAGHAPRVGSRDPGRASSLARSLGGDPARDEELARLDTLFLCVSDRALPDVAEHFARFEPHAQGAVVFHASGFEPVERLVPLGARGWSTGSFHPLLSAPAPGPGELAAGSRAQRSRAELSWVTLAGEPRARERGASLARLLGARVLTLDEDAPGARARYHGAATLAAGGVAALFDGILELAGGVTRADAAGPDATQGGAADLRRALIDLARGTLDHLERSSPAESLSGPHARGDAHVVAAHRAAVQASSPELAALYHVLSVRMIELARRRGTLDAPGREALLRALGGDAPPA